MPTASPPPVSPPLAPPGPPAAGRSRPRTDVGKRGVRREAGTSRSGEAGGVCSASQASLCLGSTAIPHSAWALSWTGRRSCQVPQNPESGALAIFPGRGTWGGCPVGLQPPPLSLSHLRKSLQCPRAASSKMEWALHKCQGSHGQHPCPGGRASSLLETWLIPPPRALVQRAPVVCQGRGCWMKPAVAPPGPGCLGHTGRAELGWASSPLSVPTPLLPFGIFKTC